MCVALALGGCAASTIADLPSPIGLPADAPARDGPDTPSVYPAVHERPARRDADLLTDEEQARLQRELRRVGERQGAATKDAAKDAAKDARKDASKDASKEPD